MKTPIIRKPKFMRNEVIMKYYVTKINYINNTMRCIGLSPSIRKEMLTELDECINKAAKFGGFFNTKGFNRWMETCNNT